MSRRTLLLFLLLFLVALHEASAFPVSLTWDAGVVQTGQVQAEQYAVSRNGVEVQRTTDLTVIDDVPGSGTYTYTVQGVGYGGISAPSNALILTAVTLPCLYSTSTTSVSLTCMIPGGAPAGPYPLRAVLGVAVDSQEAGYAGALAIDGSPATFWHTTWRGIPAPLPHSMTLDLGAVCWTDGVSYLPRQDGIPNGTLTQYRVETSLDGVAWTEQVAGTWPVNALVKTIRTPAVQARYVRLVGLASAGDGPWASAADVGIFAVPVP